jgi:uncharacterized protein (DUF1330 family)
MAITLMVSVKVEDFSKWKAAFDAASPMREKMGIKILGIYQNAEDERNVTLLSDYPSLEMARGILASPEWEAAQQKAGVIGGFDVEYFNKVQ